MVYIVLILIQILFGINYSTNKIVITSLDPLLWSNIRFFIAGFIMLGLTLILKRKHPPMTKEFFLPCFAFSFLGMSIGQVLFLYGLKYTSSINTALITSTIPVLTFLIVILRRQEKLTKLKAFGLALSFLGVFAIKDLSSVSFSSNSFIGDICVLTSSLAFALYLSFGKKFLQKYDNLWITTWMLLLSGATLSLVNVGKWSHFDGFNLSNNQLMAGAYTILGATVITYFLSNWALGKAKSSVVSLFIYLQPVVAAIIGIIYLGESLTVRMSLSACLIFTGIYFSTSNKTDLKEK